VTPQGEGQFNTDLLFVLAETTNRCRCPRRDLSNKRPPSGSVYMRLPLRTAVPAVPSLPPCPVKELWWVRLQNRASAKRPGDRPSNTGNILAHPQRTGFNRPELEAALGPEQRGSSAYPFRPPSLEVTGNYLRSSTQEDTVLSSPDVRQAPKGILRAPSAASVSSSFYCSYRNKIYS
jgi:hypothetical protein